MAEKNILVTGGAGFIGTHTCVCLLEAGYNVVVADNLCNSSQSAVLAVEKITNKSVTFYEMNVCDKEAMDKLFSKHSFDSVIHFAGLKAVGESVQKPLSYYENNLVGLFTLLDCIKRYNVSSLVFSSSATVYGDAKSPISEDAPTGGCTNPYGWTKYMSEQIIKDFALVNPDFSCALLRYFNPVGAHESGLIGESPKDKPNNLMPIIVNATFSQTPLNVFGKDYNTPDGTGVRDYIHVMDLALGHIAALNHMKTYKGVDAINLGTGQGYSVLQLIEAYEAENNVTVPYNIAPRRPGDIATCFASTEKAKKVLGWQATRGPKEICKSAHLFRVNNNI